MRNQVRDYQINSIEFAREFIEVNHPKRKIYRVIPYAFTIGSNNNSEGLPAEFNQNGCLFFGNLTICLNPNTSDLANELIRIRYRSYFNVIPYFKYITRIVEMENLINEITTSVELFDSLTIQQSSAKYDFYLTFTGYKIDVK